MTQRLKPTKKLALECANMLELSALEPHEDLDWQAVREILEKSLRGAARFVPVRPPDRLDLQDRRGARLVWRRWRRRA